MFGPLEEELGSHHFDDDVCVETFVRNWLRTRPDPFFDDGIKKLPNWWGKCVNKRRDCIEKQGVVKISFTLPINVLKQKSGSYLIRPRILLMEIFFKVCASYLPTCIFSLMATFLT